MAPLARQCSRIPKALNASATAWLLLQRIDENHGVLHAPDGVYSNQKDAKGLIIGEKTYEPEAGDSPDPAIARAAKKSEGSDQVTPHPPHNLDILKTLHQP